MIAPSPRSHLNLVPRLFVGIDVGKKNHVAGFVSTSLLKQHRRFEDCPHLSFESSGTGIAGLLKCIQQYGPLSQCAILLENTGHYHRALCEQLSTRGLTVYTIAIRTRRLNGISKTDRTDALRLANSLYAQISLGVQLPEKSQQIRELLPPTDAAARLAGCIRRRYELVQVATSTKNRLTSICDELFPEFAAIFKNPNAMIALDLRTRWPTPARLAEASLDELRVVQRGHNGASNAKLEKIRAIALTSIGITATARVESLCFEQAQLIDHLHLLEGQMEAMETRIAAIVEQSREGQILLSVTGMGTMTAAALLAGIGNIRNFTSKAALRKYCGWSPQLFQTGTSMDHSAQNPTGSRLLKREIFMLTMRAIQQDGSFWKNLFDRRVPLRCSLDARTGKYQGKLRVVGRVAGQMIGVIYALLKADADLVDALTDDPTTVTLPAPVLYDPEIHAGTKAR